MTLQAEIWKPVGDGIYEVSSLARVRRAIAGKGTREGHVLKQSIATTGYPVVTFCINGDRRVVHVHSLVAEAFIGDRPRNYMVNHKDGIKTNNMPENLEYVTRQENMEHASRMGLLQSGKNHWTFRRRNNHMNNVLNQEITKEFALYNGDCVEVTKQLPDNSIHYTIYSPPFSSLYTYSNSDRDMGNSRNDGEFLEHFKFLVKELYRITMPGRLMSVHCMNLPTSKTHHGYIGIRDFRGELIKAFQAEGWIFHSEVCIWKDPVVAQQRTKALGLLHKQIVKDSAMSRQGIPDYLVTMRKPGVNEEPISGEFEEFVGEGVDVSLEAYEKQAAEHRAKGKEPWPFEMWRSVHVWQKYASPVWMDINPSNTLQYRSAREEKDEKHICPLQLDVIARGVELWSNPGDIVFSPFTGIGSEGYQSIKMGRRFVGVELKESYYRTAVKNLRMATQEVQASEQEELALTV